jgi:thymidylate synthase
MFIKEDSVDDLMRRVIGSVLQSQDRISPKKGPARELFGILLELTNPRARLSTTETRGKVFSCLGEFVWYMAGSDNLSFITHYIKHYEKSSDDKLTVFGAYGPRLFNMRGSDQVARLLAQLKKSSDTRQAVIQLFDAQDVIKKHADVPCTCTLQFVIRNGLLHLMVHMRSNDVLLGLPHDVFSFTMLQELIAREVGVKLGKYRHSVGSLHLYEKDEQRGREFLAEGWQETSPMPAMPAGPQWHAIRKIVAIEKDLRDGVDVDIPSLGLDNYWLDLVRLLKIFSLTKKRTNEALAQAEALRKQITSPVYDIYIDERLSRPKGEKAGS